MGAPYNPSTQRRKSYIVFFMQKPLIIATWNVNSLRARMPVFSAWAERTKPDIVLLQETKVEDADFPTMEIRAMGFPYIEIHGQKSYNGVSIISNKPLSSIIKTGSLVPNAKESRFLSACVEGIHIASVYAPNGNPPDGEKFLRKMDFMSALARHAGEMLRDGKDFLLAGDFNVIPQDMDAATPERWRSDALMHPDARAAWRRLCFLGLTDAYRALHPASPGYTFWDYQGGAWQKDDGIRIDHALLSPRVADHLLACDVDRFPRGLDKPSDHTPLVFSLRA